MTKMTVADVEGVAQRSCGGDQDTEICTSPRSWGSSLSECLGGCFWVR